MVSTIEGNPFTSTQDGYISASDPAIILEAPEKGSFFVIVEVDAEDDSTALQKAWGRSDF